MNKLELVIYNFVKDNPKLKQKIVDVYQSLLGIIPQKSILTEFPFTERKGYFYGFHDKSPFSSNGKYLLTHKVLVKYDELKKDDEIEIGYFSGENWLKYIPIDTTTGWNWQLGSMLQWRGESNEEVVYNIESSGKHKSRIKNILTKETVKDLPWAISHISPNGKYGCSYNFHRTEKAMPGYGLITEHPELNIDKEDFYRIFNLDTEEVTFQVSIDEIKKINPHPSMENAFHFFHHSLFSPKSKRVFFLHRWLDENNRRWTRMFSIGIHGENIYLFPMDEMVSHITWASETEVFAYLRYPKDGEGYYLVEDITGKQKRFFNNELNSDGHPTILKEKSLVITDSYPDRYRNQYLILMDTKNNTRTNLMRTHLPKLFKRHLQVDLHPRFHPKNNIVCVDTAHRGKHSLITLDYTKAIK